MARPLTPGPWVVDEVGVGELFIVRPDGGGGSWGVAELSNDDAWSDAELLAAAPELYEALSALVKAEWMVTHDWGGDRPAVLAKAEAVLARLQDALFPVSGTHRTTEGT